MRIPSSAIIPLIVFIISLIVSPNNNKNNQKNQKKEKKEKSNNKQKFDNVNKNFANKNSNKNNTTKTGGQSQFKSNTKAQTKTSYSNDTEMDEYYIKREKNKHYDSKSNHPIYGYSYDEDKELFDLKNAIIYSEILQKPLALRK